jgi:alkylation response protein AidB-like acyl-CoA dehydrogenase
MELNSAENQVQSPVIMTPEQARQQAQNLAQHFATRAPESNRLARLAPEDIADLKSSDYLGLTVPTEYGGSGLNLHDTIAAHFLLAQGSPSTALVAAMQLQIFGHEREIREWSAEKYALFCRAAANGALFNAIASEPTLGSPSRGQIYQTVATATSDGSSYIINGHKTWATGGEYLTHLLVRVSLEGQPAVFLIEQGTRGVRWDYTWRNALSLRASDSHDVYFENVHVPADNLIVHYTTQGDKSPNVWFPMVLCAVYLGAAMAARNTLIDYAQTRIPTALGKPIATLPKIQRQIGEIDLALQAARALLFEVAAEWTGDNAQRNAYFPRVAAAKTLVTETANSVTDKALRVAGGISLTDSLPLEQYFRDVRAGLMQPPSGDTALEIIGRNALAEYDNQY